MSISSKSNFYSKFEVSSDPDACWEWKACIGRHGYGQITYKNKAYLAHRLSFLFHNGYLPENLVVCHKCDNPPCVRPDHLFLGTKKDNSMDASRKGRYQYREKLTRDQVLEILRMRSEGKTQREIGLAFGLHAVTIHYITSGKRYSRWTGITHG